MSKIKRRIKRILPKIKATIKGQHLDYTKFIVLGYARTGSTYLMAGLNTIPSIKMYHEVLAGHNRKIGEGYDKIFSSCFSKVDKDIKWVGFKLFYYHLSDEEKQKFFRISDAKIIHLKRLNKLRTIVSFAKANKTKQWAVTNNAPHDAKVHIDTSLLKDRINKILYYEDLFEKKMKNTSVLNVAYEHLAANPNEEFNRITNYLGCTDHVDLTKIPFKKQSNKTLAEEIENYQEVHDLLINTDFREYLND